MTQSFRLFSIMLCSCCALCWAEARAQAPSAEHALAGGDYVQAAERAEATLFAGGLEPAQWTQSQRILGVAHARMGRAESARRAFVSALALDPALKLTDDQPVEVRSPFMEARGFWSQHAERLAASAVLSDDRQALIVSLVDPAALVARVIVRARAVGQTSFVESSLPPASTLLISLETLGPLPGIEYALALIDENANRLWQLGSDSAPVSVAEPRAAAQVTSLASPVSGVRAPVDTPLPAAPSARPYYVGAAVALVVSVGAALVAGISHREREQLAQRWNAARCDGAGATRGQRCDHEHDQLKRQERLAIGFYSLAGAGLIAGAVSLLLAPRRAPDARAVRCQSGPGLAGLACGTAF